MSAQAFRPVTGLVLAALGCSEVIIQPLADGGALPGMDASQPPTADASAGIDAGTPPGRDAGTGMVAW